VQRNDDDLGRCRNQHHNNAGKQEYQKGVIYLTILFVSRNY